MTYTLTVFNTWQVTLPKAYRSKHATKHYTAEEVQWGWLLLKPIANQSDVVYYEDKGWFGLYAEEGINVKEVISTIKKLRKDG